MDSEFESRNPGLTMPLLILSGPPSTGKTTIANRVVDALKERNIDPILITDSSVNSEHSRSSAFYQDKRKSVDHINSLKSEVVRILLANNKKFVVVDSLNYARSQRYELFTIAKNNRTSFCILFCDANVETSDWLNSQHADKYDSGMLEDLRSRFERPKPHLKGDKPLIELTIAHPNDPLYNDHNTPRNVSLPLDDLYDVLIVGKSLEENRSNVITTKLSSGSMYEIDDITQKIVKHIVENQHNIGLGGVLTLPWSNNVKFTIKRFHTLISLNRSRASFMNMARQGLVSASEALIDKRFVEYITATE